MPLMGPPKYVGPPHLRYADGFMEIWTNVQTLQVPIAAAEIAEKCLHHPIVKAACEAYAKEIQSYWKSIAPVSSRPAHPYSKYSRDEEKWDHPGDYRDSIQVRSWANAKGFGARVFTNDVKAAWLEYGSVHNPEYGYADKTAERFGGRQEHDAADDAKAAEKIGLAFCKAVA